MKRVSILFSATALAASALLAGQACSSSDDTDQGVGNLTGGTAPVGAAGSAAAPAAGSGGSTSNGSTPPAPSGAAGTEAAPPLAPPAAGGSANAGAGAAGAAGATDGEQAGAGAAGAPMGGLPVPPPETACPGAVSNGGMCVITCTDDCGVFNLGLRLCTCTDSAYDCETCGFEGVDDPLLVPPTGDLPPCALIDELQEDDESGCVENDRCQSIGREDPDAAFENRFCACRAGGWDCDSKPASFGN